MQTILQRSFGVILVLLGSMSSLAWGWEMVSDGGLRFPDAVLITYNQAPGDGFRFQAAHWGGEIKLVTRNGSSGVSYSTVFDDQGNLGVSSQVSAPVVAITSDARLKTDITPLTEALEKLTKLRGVTYDWNAQAKAMGRAPGGREIGVIAQEVEAVFPELVTTWGEDDYKAVQYGKLTGVLSQAVKELRAEKDAQISALEARLEYLGSGLPLHIK